MLGTLAAARRPLSKGQRVAAGSAVRPGVPAKESTGSRRRPRWASFEPAARCRSLSLASATPLFSFGKCHPSWATGREGKLAEQKSVALSLVPWSEFLLKNSLPASQNHRKGGIFHMLTEPRGSARWEEGRGERTGSKEWGHQVQKQTSSLLKVLDRPTERWVSMEEMQESILSKTVRGRLP